MEELAIATSDTNDTNDTILLFSCSAFQATAHDDAHGAFMTLPPYTSTREGEAPQLGSDPTPCRLGLCVRKYRAPFNSKKDCSMRSRPWTTGRGLRSRRQRVALVGV